MGQRWRRGAFVDGKKRLGKIFTSMSISEGDHHTPLSNSTISGKRKLMMQRSQVTSLFGAETLWRKGYTGSKVKMAIFDTGIRANHPHFCNIKYVTGTVELIRTWQYGTLLMVDLDFLRMNTLKKRLRS